MCRVEPQYPVSSRHSEYIRTHASSLARFLRSSGEASGALRMPSSWSRKADFTVVGWSNATAHSAKRPTRRVVVVRQPVVLRDVVGIEDQPALADQIVQVGFRK